MSNDKLKTIDELIELLKDKFPLAAQFDFRGYDAKVFGFSVLVNWKLYNDEMRPNKTSKYIRIIIENDVIEDYSTNLEKDKMKKAFAKFIDSKLKNFNPEHNGPYLKTPPAETWVFDAEYMF